MELPESHHVHEVEQIFSSLTEEIPKVQAFKGKWILIRAKLDDFENQLRAFFELPYFSTSQLASELVLSISQTLKDAFSLARKCLNPNPTDGKLRTQSDIDSVSAILDQHIKDIDLLIEYGVLQETDNDDNESGSLSSVKESVPVEARNLVTRLRMGNSEFKNSAMDSLLGLLNQDAKNVLVAAAQGVVPVLVGLLDSNCMDIKEKAVYAISRISIEDSCNHILVSEGVLLINNLLRVLKSGSDFAEEKACVALQALSLSKENARTIASRGGIVSLLEITQIGAPGAQAYAARVLRNLSGFVEIREIFIEENAITALIGVVASGRTSATQENAIWCMSNLVSDDENLKLFVVKEGGIEVLKDFWNAAPRVQSLEAAIGLLKTLAYCRKIRDALVSEGFVDKLVGVLNCGVVGVRIAAAGAVYELSFSPKARKKMGETGALPQLIRMLEAKAIEEKEMAAKALSSLMLYTGNTTILAKDEKAIKCIVELLDPSVQNFNKEYLITILASVANSKRCRKQMAAAGACAYLQKLVEMNTDGAKKLYEKLDRNKNWSMFARRKSKQY